MCCLAAAAAAAAAGAAGAAARRDEFRIRAANRAIRALELLPTPLQSLQVRCVSQCITESHCLKPSARGFHADTGAAAYATAGE
jgi:hypothetical protein